MKLSVQTTVEGEENGDFVLIKGGEVWNTRSLKPRVCPVSERERDRFRKNKLHLFNVRNWKMRLTSQCHLMNYCK